MGNSKKRRIAQLIALVCLLLGLYGLYHLGWKALFVVVGIPVLWVLALSIDDKFLGGRFLMKSHKDRKEVTALLRDVLREGKRPLGQWDKGTYFWFWDEFYLVSFFDPELEKVRTDIVRSMHAHSNDDEPLHSEIVEKIEKHVAALQ